MREELWETEEEHLLRLEPGEGGRTSRRLTWSRWHVSCKYRNHPDEVSVIGGGGWVIPERGNITTVLVVYGCCKKLPQVGGLKQQSFILSVL